MKKCKCARIATILVTLLLTALPLSAVTYENVTTNMGYYTLRDQTDTWTDSFMVITNGMILESNAAVNVINTTVDYFRPLKAPDSRQTNYVGRTGPSTLWVSNSTMNVVWLYYIGVRNSSSVKLIDSTLLAERDPNNGTFNMHIGNGSGNHTGTLELVNSRVLYNSVNFGGHIWLGVGCFGRLKLYRSTLGTSVYHFETLASYSLVADDAEQVVAWFDASTVMVSRCTVGGNPDYGSSNGRFTFTNSSLLRLTRKPSWQKFPGLHVGHSCGLNYTSTVTVSGSRVENDFPTVVGRNVKTGRGILTFCDDSVAILNDTVTLGVNRDPAWEPGFGHLDIRSGAQVFVTNTTATSRLTVGQAGRGLLTIDGGTCRAYRLFVTNGTDSVISFSRGLLAVHTGAISNEVPFIIGDGGGAATLEHWGGTTTVSGDMTFAANSRWKIDADLSSGTALDVCGTLTFAPDTSLSLSTSGPDLKFMDDQVIAYADAVFGVPTVTEDERLQVKVVSVGTRKALVLRYPKGTMILVR